MKIVYLIAFILAMSTVTSTNVLKAESSEQVLSYLQGNNYNIYIIFFGDFSSESSNKKQINEDIEEKLTTLLNENEEIVFAKIDYTNPDFEKLTKTVGVSELPTILLSVHGKGVWLTGTKANLLVDRIRDFLPDFKQSSSHHTPPY